LWAIGPEHWDSVKEFLPKSLPGLIRLDSKQMAEAWKLYISAIQKRLKNPKACHFADTLKTWKELQTFKNIFK
jgi:hypothetical protein